MSNTETRTGQDQGQAAGEPPPGPLPIPPDFPIAWEQPGDEQTLWWMDRMHSPTQIAPMTDSFLRGIFHEGFNRGAAVYDAPVHAMVRRFNTYHYQHLGPPPLPPEELQAMGARAQERIGAVLGQYWERWQGTWLPDIKRELAGFAIPERARTDRAAFLAHFDESMARHQRLWSIHFEIAFPMLLAMSLFHDAHRDLFGDDDAFDSLRLLQGFENETLRANRELWRLSRSAAAVPAVRRAIEETPSRDIARALADSAEGRAFLAELDAYLAEYGRRGSDFVGLDQPSWIEDPTPVLDALRGYLAGPGTDPEEERAAMAASREELLARTRARLQGYPQQAVGQFEFLLKAAQEAVVLSEDHGWYIDWRECYEARQVLLQAGEHLAAAGAIAERDDIFYLTFEEARESLVEPGTNRRDAIAERKAEMARFAAITPPPMVGTPPAGPPPPDDPFGRALGKFFGGPPPASQEPGTLRGNAGSPGRATGRAVILHSLAEAGRLQRGDILVAATTAPPWTPFFATAAAVVTDTGGILSHSAVVAREYRIPAVVGAAEATAAIPDGATIEVDGDAGTVRILA